MDHTDRTGLQSILRDYSKRKISEAEINAMTDEQLIDSVLIDTMCFPKEEVAEMSEDTKIETIETEIMLAQED